jgi:hypothetical protein
MPDLERMVGEGHFISALQALAHGVAESTCGNTSNTHLRKIPILGHSHMNITPIVLALRP